MATHPKRITAAVTPDTAAIYENLAAAAGRTLSSLVNDVLVSRALEVAHFLEWFNQQPTDSAQFMHGLTAVEQIGTISLIDAIREVDPAYRTPEEVLEERKDQGEAVLQLMEGTTINDADERARLADALLKARDEVTEQHAKLRDARKRDREVLSVGYAGTIGGRRR